MDKIFNETFKYAKKLAKDFYFKVWAKNPPYCPAFKNEKIGIGHEGWNHTVTTIRRTKMDVLGRLFCLERARYLLENSLTFQERRKIRELEFWIFESIVEDVKVKVIVRSIEGGKKHFYSVIRRGSVEDEIEE